MLAHLVESVSESEAGTSCDMSQRMWPGVVDVVGSSID